MPLLLHFLGDSAAHITLSSPISCPVARSLPPRRMALGVMHLASERLASSLGWSRSCLPSPRMTCEGRDTRRAAMATMRDALAAVGKMAMEEVSKPGDDGGGGGERL